MREPLLGEDYFLFLVGWNSSSRGMILDFEKSHFNLYKF